MTALAASGSAASPTPISNHPLQMSGGGGAAAAAAAAAPSTANEQQHRVISQGSGENRNERHTSVTHQSVIANQTQAQGPAVVRRGRGRFRETGDNFFGRAPSDESDV